MEFLIPMFLIVTLPAAVLHALLTTPKTWLLWLTLIACDLGIALLLIAGYHHWQEDVSFGERSSIMRYSR